MITFAYAFPPVESYTCGTPKERILHTLSVVGETDTATLAFRTCLSLEEVYMEVTMLAKRKALTIRPGPREYVTVRLLGAV